MADQTKIEWTDATVNFWWGCTKVGPGCDGCYAEAWDKRTGGDHWGPHAPRRKIARAAATLRRIERRAPAFHAEHGRWPRVFLHSMSDLFDNAVPESWRAEAFAEIEAASRTRPQIVTKRVGNVERMVPAAWRDGGWPQHVGLMVTVVNQEEADRDVPKLLDLKGRLGIPWIGLSMEPLLGPVDFHVPFAGGKVNALAGALPAVPSLDWIIVGGESGSGARPMHPGWARDIRDQCQAAGVAFFFKQWGEWAPGEIAGPNERAIDAATWWNKVWNYERVGKAQPDEHRDDEPDVFRTGKRAAGRLLDGRTWDEVPG